MGLKFDRGGSKVSFLAEYRDSNMCHRDHRNIALLGVHCTVCLHLQQRLLLYCLYVQTIVPFITILERGGGMHCSIPLVVPADLQIGCGYMGGLCGTLNIPRYWLYPEYIY